MHQVNSDEGEATPNEIGNQPRRHRRLQMLECEATSSVLEELSG